MCKVEFTNDFYEIEDSLDRSYQLQQIEHELSEFHLFDKELDYIEIDFCISGIYGCCNQYVWYSSDDAYIFKFKVNPELGCLQIEHTVCKHYFNTNAEDSS